MCDTCGCGDPEVSEVRESILAGNSEKAKHNREHFNKRGAWVVNLMGSPGAGKTAVLEATSRALGGRRRVSAMAGDLETERDAERLRAAGVPTVAITTGSACHLDAQMVHRAANELTFDGMHYLFIENVGNLVCPAIYDLGQSANVVALAVTEGEDKPLKYPVIFKNAELVLLTKIDLLPHLDVRISAIREALARVMPRPTMIPLSARTGQGIEHWIEWLEAHRFVDSWRAQAAGLI
jgi:hydrogenase nickel incorporation protein HypB